MPYPVPPPTPPPVIDVSQPEESTSFEFTSTVVSTAFPTTEYPSSRTEGAADAVDWSSQLAHDRPAEEVAVVEPTATPVGPISAAETQPLGAESLGGPIGLGFSEPPSVQPQPSQSGIILEESARPDPDLSSVALVPSSALSDLPSTYTGSTYTGARLSSTEEVQLPDIHFMVQGSLAQLDFPFDPGEPDFDLEAQPPFPSGEILEIPNTGEDFILEDDPFLEGLPERRTPFPAEQPETTPQPEILDPAGTGEAVELSADRQSFDEQRRVFTAEGNAVMRFRQAILRADRLQVNLDNRIAVAEGNVRLIRGQQLLEGDRFRFNFVQEQGTVFNASGEIFLPAAGQDLSPGLPTDVTAGIERDQTLSEQLAENQPPQQVTSPGGIGLLLGSGRVQGPQGGELRRLRFEAEQIEFTPEGWQATNIRITNDPFSPPELELRADTATYTRLSETQSEIRARRPRLVFDQGFSLPLLRSRVLLDSRERDPFLVQFGYDREDRGGLFIERSFEPISTPQLRFRVRPQFFVQKAVEGEGFFDPSVFGLITSLDATLGPRTILDADAVFTSLDLSELENELRASIRLRQLIGDHQLALEYSYRDRLFNGSLGFQNVQRSLGFVLSSPTYVLGDSGIRLNYQVGAQSINANTDRLDLLPRPLPPVGQRRITLGRYQAAVALSRPFSIWRGQPLPATATEGLRYTPAPVVPFVQVITGLRGDTSFYDSGDNQSTLTGTIGIRGQIGHFSRPAFDYLGFNLTYSQTLRDGLSPFRFDRAVDQSVLRGGLIGQIIGPFRAGFQTAYNLNTGRELSTDYILEYSRRTYGVTLRYNPVRETGSINLQINDFNWRGRTEPFSRPIIEP